MTIADAGSSGCDIAMPLPGSLPAHLTHRSSPATALRPAQARDGIAAGLARHAIGALHDELVLYPKPGLVSLRDNGAHADMDASTFMRSLFALRGYFRAVAEAGARSASFDELRALGRAAEQRMIAATGGVNTHRGAIFGVGLLCAGSAVLLARGAAVSDDALRAALAPWLQAVSRAAVGAREAALACGQRPPLRFAVAGERVVRTLSHAQRPEPGLAARCKRGTTLSDGQLPALDFPVGSERVTAALSHGQLSQLRFGAAGARGEACAGFPSVFELALPALRSALAQGAAPDVARLHALFCLLAVVEDTNVLYRGGRAGLDFVRSGARAFLTRGSVFRSGWRHQAQRLHEQCCERGLSPGGCADLLGATCFVHRVQTI